MTRKQRRLTFIGVVGTVLAAAVGLVFAAMGDKVAYFKTPSELVAMHSDPDRRIRLGGLVEDGSLDRGEGTTVTFRVTDTADAVTVSYTGILPDLFREGQGVVAEGVLQDGVFRADTVLARHDENYMPKEVADALKEQNHYYESGTVTQ
ncbi:cytochrome c maturation protein CcmE [Amorphus orientalis]|uniref:Cytochrome c-type biogenesis protein CcmE n=1 Tax=Amorphus orientalis TaxID=649198 RepID=A0AAE4ASH7_9HYPH|nr:cytochrome c maturation protein CcmE [Amorphus orientalis]MDQ0315132.1 cytochrome c-type biogenesis protein CcmE [Amorphus orientalis]